MDNISQLVYIMELLLLEIKKEKKNYQLIEHNQFGQLVGFQLEKKNKKK
jgi:hypothetical protein